MYLFNIYLFNCIHIYAYKYLEDTYVCVYIYIYIYTLPRVHTDKENQEKSCNFKMFMPRPGKVLEKKNCNPKSFGKVMQICYIHMFIYVEFEIINMLLKERRSKYKPAYDLILCHSNSREGV